MTVVYVDLETATREELYEARSRIHARLFDLETEARIHASRPLVGKCFKVRTDVSLLSANKDCLWRYVRVASMDKNGFLTVIQFERNVDRMISVVQRDGWDHGDLLLHHEIAADELAAQWARFQSEMSGVAAGAL